MSYADDVGNCADVMEVCATFAPCVYRVASLCTQSLGSAIDVMEFVESRRRLVVITQVRCAAHARPPPVVV